MAKNELALVSERTRAKILEMLLSLENPPTFSDLLRQLKTASQGKQSISSRTLTKHLKSLEQEGLISPKIEKREGKKGKGRNVVVFEVAKLKSVLELRKDFRKQFMHLLRVYGSGLNPKTQDLIQPFWDSLSESIKHPEKEAKTTRIFPWSIKLDKDVKSVEVSAKPYGKVEIKKKKPQPKTPKTKAFKNKRKHLPKEPESTKDPRFYGKQNAKAHNENNLTPQEIEYFIKHNSSCKITDKPR